MALKSPFSRHLEENDVLSIEEIQLIKKFIQGEQETLDSLDVELAGVREAISELLDRQRALQTRRSLQVEFIKRHSALLSPMRALPLDILHQVFMALRTSHAEWMESNQHKQKIHHPMIALSHVCRQWRSLSLGMPLLWVDLPFNSLPCYSPGAVITPSDSDRLFRFPQSMASLTEMVAAFISRSASCPVNFSLTAKDPRIIIFQEDVEFSKSINPLVDVLLKARWGDVVLDLRFFPSSSPLKRFLPIPSHSRETIRTIKVYVSGTGMLGGDLSIVDRGGTSPQHLRSLDIDIPGQKLREVAVDWPRLTEFSMGPTWSQRHHSWHGRGSRPTLTPEEALSMLRHCRSLIRCQIRLNPGSQQVQVTVFAGPLSEAQITLRHLESLEIWASPAPRSFAASLLTPSLRRLSTIYENFNGHRAPEGISDSALCHWIGTHGEQLVDVSFDYASLTPPALEFCLEHLPNVRSLTIVPFMFHRNEEIQRSTRWHPDSATMDHELLQRLTPKFSNAGSLLELCICPKLETISISMRSVEGYDHAGKWREIIASRRSPHLRSGSGLVSYLNCVSVTFH